MLHLILGGCGTGKSIRLMQEIRNAVASGKKAAVLFPEQFSFEGEKRLHQELGTQVFNCVETYSFMTLSNTLLLQARSSRAGNYASDQEKLIYLWQAVKECTENGELLILGKRAASVGFLSDLTQLVTKLRKAGVTGEQMIETAPRLHERLGYKVSDLGRLLIAYDRILSAHGRNDSLASLTEAAMLASQNDFLTSRCFFIDEFDSFTADQYRMLAEMISRCPSVTCAVRADDPTKRPTGIFVGGNKTCMELRRIAGESGIAVQTDYLADFRRSVHADLAAAVGQIFRSHTSAAPYEGHLHVTCARDPEEEVSYICARICELLSQDESLHCRDIAIAVKNPAVYLPRLKRAMERYGLPYDSTEERPLLHTELVRHVLTVLELIVSSRWDTGLLLRYVKSQFSGYDTDQAAMLEHFCFTWSIEHEDWEQPFYDEEHGNVRAEDFGGSKLEALRLSLIGELKALRSACTGKSVRAVCTALYEHLTAKRGAREDAIKKMDEIGQKDFAMVWNLLCTCLDTLVTAHGKAVLPLRQIYEQLMLLLQTSSFSVPPQLLDSVHIVDARTSRLNAPKILFVPGVLEGELPGDVTLSGLFNAHELHILDGEKICISRLLPELHSDELMIVVRLLSSPSEQLWLTYPSLDADGCTCVSSPIIDELQSMFREPITDPAEALPLSFFVRSLRSAYDTYVRHMHEDTPETAALREMLSEYPEYAVRLARLTQEPATHAVSPEVMDRLLGARLILSPSGIERYYQCAFAYFCNYVLHLYIPEQISFSSQNIGNFTHYCLEQILRETDMDDFLALDKAGLGRLIQTYSERYSKENFSDAMLRSARFRMNYRSTGDSLMELLQIMQESFRHEGFRPVGCEIGVEAEPKEGEYPALSLDGGRILCAGKIDRVDLHAAEHLIRVVDYKTGDKSLVPEKLRFGLDMQMLLYLFALKQGGAFGGAAPAGVLYLPAGQLTRERYEQRTEHVRERSAILEDHFLSRGLLTEEAAASMEMRIQERAVPVFQHGAKDSLFTVTQAQMEHLEQHVKAQVTAMGEKLRAGEIAPVPRRLPHADPCTYCKYGDLCGKRETAKPKSLSDDEKQEALLTVFGAGQKEDEDNA